MLFKFNESHVGEIATADVIVVGAGAVGLCLAIDLARRGKRVAVLEAGGEAVAADSQRFFESAASVGYPLEGLHVGRFRALGGTTNFWGGQLVPFDAGTFELRPWIAPHSWPITFSDVEPYYKRAFAIMGLDHQKTDAEVWRTVKVEPPYTEGLELFLARWAPEPNFASLFRAEIQRSKLINVYLNAQVSGLYCDSRQNKITAIAIGDGTAPSHRVPASTLALAAGTIEIVRLLRMKLADGQPAPWSQNRWLGHAFVDHIDFHVGELKVLNKPRFHSIFDNIFLGGLKYSPRLRRSERSPVHRESVAVAAHIIFNSSVSEHVANLKIFVKALLRGKFRRVSIASLKDLLAVASVGLPMVARYLRYRRIRNYADGGIGLRVTAEQVPVYESEISILEAQRDELNMPLVKVDWRIDGSELEAIASFAEEIEAFLSSNNLATLSIDPRLKARDPSFLKTVDDANHQMGGARMSIAPCEGVVDTNLKVHSIDNLYIAGAAVYPTTGFANPTFTAIALGLRLAAHLADGAKPSD